MVSAMSCIKAIVCPYPFTPIPSPEELEAAGDSSADSPMRPLISDRRTRAPMELPVGFSPYFSRLDVVHPCFSRPLQNPTAVMNAGWDVEKLELLHLSKDYIAAITQDHLDDNPNRSKRDRPFGNPNLRFATDGRDRLGRISRWS